MGFSYPGKFKSLTINAGSYYDCDGICRKPLIKLIKIQKNKHKPKIDTRLDYIKMVCNN